ncbi:MAG: ABC transporter permease [Longimicrobiales bacterium]
MSWLDFKLGFRMLVKYPVLTLVGGLAMAFAIWIGAGTFELVTRVIDPTLPLPDGHRIVGIQNRDLASADLDEPGLHDFVTWREELESIESLGAFRTFERNLIVGEGPGEPIEVSAISASAFRVARVPPLLGRVLIEEDEQSGAPAIVLIGHEVWQTRFESDPGVVGRELRLGDARHTVIGVMPEGFAFPVNDRLWVPLRLEVLDYERGAGPAVHVFGRLAPGATLEEAQAELATLGRRVAADFLETHEHLRPTVMPYAESLFPMRVDMVLRAGIYSINLLGVLLIVLMCGNVALLMFARAATRENEITIRYAMGASRGRIIAQLFAEALVLGALAAVVGLTAAGFGLSWFFDSVVAELSDGERLPFWIDASLSPATVLYAGVLTVLGASLAGVVPALKATRGVEARLRQASAGGGGFRFGGVWTAVIVAQVAITVFVPIFAYIVQFDVIRLRTADVGFAEEEYLTARLEQDRQAPVAAASDTSRAESLAGSRAIYQELERRLAAEPGVLGVTFADRLPRMYHPWNLVELDEGGAAPLDPHWPAYRVSSASVAPDYFDVLDAPILAGRGFHTADVGSRPGVEPGVVVVNQSFVKLVLGGRNPIGRHVRYTLQDESDAFSPDRPSPWYEIVGVVPDLGTNLGVSSAGDPKVAAVYHPIAPGTASPSHVALHVRGDPAAFAPRLRGVATAVDPTLRLYDVMPLDELSDSALDFLYFWLAMIALVVAITLLLSLAGIYAVMSFTVTQRTREIGIRIALGADRRRLIVEIFKRPLAQIALGIVVGAGMLVALWGGVPSAEGVALILASVALMVAAGVLACLLPTRRALAIQPTQALKADG